MDSTKTNEYGRTYTLNGLAHVYHATGKETDAIAALEKSLTISVKNLYRDKTREAYGLLYQIYEARGEFKRAFDYYRQFVTYRDSVFNASLTQYIENQNISLENESLRRETELKDARTNEYGRADKAAAWALLSRLYLNAQVYTGTAKYSGWCIGKTF